MIVNPPKIDRSKTREQESTHRQALRLLRQIEGLLRPGECLGTPHREGDRVIVPLTALEESLPPFGITEATMN